MKRLFPALLLVALTAVPALASDHTNLDADQPTEVEDAYPVEFRDRQIQGIVRYIREEHKKNRMVYQPGIEAGIFPNTQLEVSGTLYSGNAGDQGSGDVSASLLYNFNAESVWVPAMAVEVEGDFPTGKDSRGVDYSAKLIFSKMPYVRTTLLHRIHVNLIYKHNAGRDRETERSDMFKGIFGFSMRACKDTVFVADYVREQKEEKDEDSNVVEAGIRRQLTPYTQLSFGAGAGVGEESERYRVTLALQHSF